MPALVELLENQQLSDDESESEEEESGSGDDDDEEDDESGSGSDDDDDDEDDDDDDDDDDEDDDDSDNSDDSDKPKKKKKKEDKENKEPEMTEEERRRNTIYEIQTISQKLTWLLDDIHEQFKPNIKPNISPQNVFPYSTNLEYVSYNKPINNNLNNNCLTQTNFSIHQNDNNNISSPISSPIIHKNDRSMDRAAGGNFVFPSYAKPPKKNEINKLYKYNDYEKRRINENRINKWNQGFSDKLIKKSFDKKRNIVNEMKNEYTFSDLYKHYDKQKKEKIYNNNNLNKNKIIYQNKIKNKSSKIVNQAKYNINKAEKNLLKKAEQLLLGSNIDDDSSALSPRIITNDGNEIVMNDTMDSLHERIVADHNDKDRIPTFV